MWPAARQLGDLLETPCPAREAGFRLQGRLRLALRGSPGAGDWRLAPAVSSTGIGVSAVGILREDEPLSPATELLLRIWQLCHILYSQLDLRDLCSLHWSARVS